MTDTLYRISIHTVASLADVLEEALPGAGHPVSVWQDADSAAARVDCFVPDMETAMRTAESFSAYAADLSRGETWTIAVDAIPHEDWAESWKRFFHPERVSERVIVRPSWESMPLNPGDVEVVIDAGMCFGTGQHGTTRACIRFLDALSARGKTGSLLDAGCGSGILSIAAAKLGFVPITAIDLDASAVQQAGENCRSNGVAENVALETADVLKYAPAKPFDCVAANIEAPILLQAADVLTAALCSPKRGAALLLAGILERQYEGVASAFRERGFQELQRVTLDGWTSGWWERL